MALTPENRIVIEKAKAWFKDTMITNHIKNTEKCAKASHLDINPFLAPYLSAFLTGAVSEAGIAKVLVYSRALVTSITTSFGTNLQKFVSKVLVDAYGSVEDGIDIKFKDCVDGRIKYAQLKLGPNTINKDDVKTIDGHFHAIRNRARVNDVDIGSNNLIIGVMYGTDDMLSGHYRALRETHHYNVFVGKDFWKRLTGEPDFFDALILALTEVVAEVNSMGVLEETIRKLSEDPEIKLLASLGKNSNIKQ